MNRKQDICDAVEETLVEQGVPIGLRETIIDDVWQRLNDEMREDDDE